MPEDAVERAVENEIRRRIDGQQEVSDLPDAANQITGFVVTELEDRRHDGIRCDADDEDHDDRD